MQYDGGLGPLCCPLSSFDPPLILIPMSSNPNPMIDPKAARAWLEGHKGVRGAWGDWGDWSTSDASGSSRVSRAFRALQAGDENWLRDEVAQRLSEHLQVIRLRPESWLHWRPQRSGAKGEALLRARYPQAQGLAWTGVDRPSKVPGPASQVPTRLPPPEQHWTGSTWQRLTAWVAEMVQPSQGGELALACQVVTDAEPWQTDLVWSNLTLHHESDPGLVMKTWLERLKPGGVVLFSCFGPDTLQELRELYQKKGWPTPMHPMTDMHDWGDLLVQCGFSEPVMDMEHLTLHYREVDTLIAELRSLGANLHPERLPHVRTRSWLSELKEALRMAASPGANLGIPLTFEVIYGHAFKPSPMTPHLAVQPQTEISLDTMRAQLLARKKT